MTNFKTLNSSEQELLLNFPIYISLLAANADGRLDEEEKLSAIEFNHIKTFSCDPKLSDFFEKVDINFRHNLNVLNEGLPDSKVQRDYEIKMKLAELEIIVLKLGSEYAAIMHKSMKSFKDHVSDAHHNVLLDFIFPIPVKGLSN